MRIPGLAMLLLAAGCAHARDPRIVATVEASDTIQASFTADTARLQAGAAPTDQAGVQALAAVVASQLQTVGKLQPDRREGGEELLTVELPAPGWALRARIAPRPELLCQVTLEPLALVPGEHVVAAAPWSVQDALARVRRGLENLQPAREPAMDAQRFARLRAEATEAARGGHDPALTPAEFVRTPRPIRSEGVEAPYYAPAAEPGSELKSEQ